MDVNRFAGKSATVRCFTDPPHQKKCAKRRDSAQDWAEFYEL